MNKEEVKPAKEQAKFSKAAFVEASKTKKERFELMALLEDKQYTKSEVKKIVSDWKREVVK